MLLQPRAELEAALESSFGNFDNDTLSGGGGGGSLLQSPCKSEDNDTQEENNTDMGTESGTVRNRTVGHEETSSV
jgi:hypothetical protein